MGAQSQSQPQPQQQSLAFDQPSACRPDAGRRSRPTASASRRTHAEPSWFSPLTPFYPPIAPPVPSDRLDRDPEHERWLRKNGISKSPFRPASDYADPLKRAAFEEPRKAPKSSSADDLRDARRSHSRRLLDAKEAASVLGINLRALYRYVNEGRIPAPTRTAKGALRFSSELIDAIANIGIESLQLRRGQQKDRSLSTD